MQLTRQKLFSQMDSLVHIWKRDASALDFIWLARFRFLYLYSFFKFLLILLAGMIGTQFHMLFSPSTRASLLFLAIVISLGIIALVLLLVLGFGFANRFRLSRSNGILLLCATDLCLVLAVLSASMFESKLPLLLVLGLTSCITPLFVERISRYARRFTFKAIELVEARQENEMLLLKHAEELEKAIEQERLSLKHELHDGLLQELSALLLQVSLILMRNSADERVQFKAEEAEKLKIALDRAVHEARDLIETMNTRTALQETHSMRS